MTQAARLSRATGLGILLASALTVTIASGSSASDGSSTVWSDGGSSPSAGARTWYAADLPPQPGAVTVREDFSDPAKHHFRTASNPTFAVRAAGGTYRMLLKRSGLPHGELHDVGADVETVSIALDMSASTWAGGSFMGPLCFYQQGFGFSLRLKSNGSYSLIQLTPDGKTMATLASGKVAPSSPATVHRVRLDCTWGPDQSTLVGWIDGTRVGPTQDEAGPGRNILRQWSQIGFWAMTTKAPTTFRIDNVVISEKPAPVPAPAPTPTPSPTATPPPDPTPGAVFYLPTGIASIDSLYGEQANNGQLSAAQARFPFIWVSVLGAAGEEMWRGTCSNWVSPFFRDLFVDDLVAGLVSEGLLADMNLADQEAWAKETLKTVTTLFCENKGYTYPA